MVVVASEVDVATPEVSTKSLLRVSRRVAIPKQPSQLELRPMRLSRISSEGWGIQSEGGQHNLLSRRRRKCLRYALARMSKLLEWHCSDVMHRRGV